MSDATNINNIIGTITHTPYSSGLNFTTLYKKFTQSM